MKAFYLLLAGFFMANTAFAVVDAGKLPITDVSKTEAVKGLPSDLGSLTYEDFVAMTPKKFEKATGQKLGIKKSLQLKAAQKAVKREFGGTDSDIPKGVYIILAILGWAWLVMGIADDFGGKNWWVNLLLVILCWLPGVIHAFVKMKEYYK